MGDNEIQKILLDPFYGSAFSQLNSLEIIRRAGFFDDGHALGSQRLQQDPNWLTTPFHKVVNRLDQLLFSKKINSDAPFLVLVTTGALCPVHKSHIEMMELARTELENRGCIVLGGYLSPSHDKYVQPKCGRKALNALHRIHLCEQAVYPSDWLMADPWESLYNDREVNFTDVITRLEQYLAKHVRSPKPIHIVYVFGSDNSEFAYTFLNKGWCVCIPRTGYEKKFQAISSNLDLTSNPQIIFGNKLTENASSTFVRNGKEEMLSDDVRNTYTIWQNHAVNVNPKVQSCEYHLRNEGDWSILPWIKLRDKNKLHHSWNVFIEALKNTLQKHFLSVNTPDLPINLKIYLHHLENQLQEARGLTKDTKVISLDPCIPGDFNLGISRCFKLCTGKSPSKLVPRPGSPSIETQIQNIPSGEFILFDDDIATGSTMKNVMDRLPDYIKILKCVSLIKLEGDILDVSDCRDFLAGAREAGLVVTMPDGSLARAPYMLPYVAPFHRACVPICKELEFSISVWKLNMEFFKKIDPPILLGETSKPFQHLMTYLGFKQSDTMESICKWHLDRFV